MCHLMCHTWFLVFDLSRGIYRRLRAVHANVCISEREQCTSRGLLRACFADIDAYLLMHWMDHMGVACYVRFCLFILRSCVVC